MMFSIAWWHWLVLAGFWCLVVVAAVWLLGRVAPADPSPTGARAVLDERLARGELDPEQYRRMRELIER
jgi:putative membrane protein